MENSSYIWLERFEADHAMPHDQASQPHDKVKPSDPNTAFSLQTTASDFARFLGTALDPNVLTDGIGSDWFAQRVQVPKGGFTCLDPTPPELNTNVAWGLGWGLETSRGNFFHWGANDGFKAFALGSLQDRRAFVFFANSDNGLAIVPSIADAIMPGTHPSFAWLGVGN